MSQQILVLNTNTKRETGRKAQLGNISAAKAVADIIRTCLGPRAMLKMLLDPMAGLVMTNDGNAILREIDVNHPAAKSMIELSRAQDEEVGDGTTSVVILAGEVLSVAEPWLEKGIHPNVIISSYTRALDDILAHLNTLKVKVDDEAKILSLVESSVATKFISRWAQPMSKMALEAVRMVENELHGRREIDIKKFSKVEKIPGGEIEECRVLHGVLLNKDITHSKMRRRIENPRILLLDCNLEYKKGENVTNVEISGENDFQTLLKMEEQYIERICSDIIQFKPDLVITEKGISDLAQHYLVKNGITALRRLRKTDNNRIARAVGATIVSRTDEIKESDIGTGCGIFEIKKIGDEYYTFIDKCKNPKACTILLRGASKDVLNEVERNLQDAMNVARNILLEPYLLPGGGATEMSLAQLLTVKSKSIEGVAQWPYRSIADALEIIPRTLAQNCGANTVRVVTELRAKHAQDPVKNASWGINGTTGEVVDMKELNIWEPLLVKSQAIKSAIESAVMLLRVDDIVSGLAKRGGGDQPPVPGGAEGGDD